MTETRPTGAVSYQLEISIQAAPDRVWAALTGEIQAWWLPDFHMVAPDSVVTLEPRAGGQLLEATADGGSLQWYSVQMCVPGVSLHLVGHVAPAWGGPATTMLSLELRPEGGGTRLVVQDALFGCVTEVTARSLEQGWRQLFDEGLRRYAEG